MTGQSVSTRRGTALFGLLRLADILVQYHLLRSGLLTSCVQFAGGTAQPVQAWSLFGTYQGELLPGLNPYFSLFVLVAAATTLKQILWITSVKKQSLSMGEACRAPFWNSILNVLNSFLAVWTTSSNAPERGLLSSASVCFGLALFIAGLCIEAVSEKQRADFHSSENLEHVPYGGGLFSVATNVNYGGLLLWRTGAAIIAGGWPWGGALASILFCHFLFFVVPAMEDRCVNKYGHKWLEIKYDTRYRLLPFIA